MEVVQALLEAGADATAQDKYGRTPLHEAAWSPSSQGTAGGMRWKRRVTGGRRRAADEDESGEGRGTRTRRG
ncbi:hypothetical protein BC826DRAFT_1073967, partial [Russula brevipes]